MLKIATVILLIVLIFGGVYSLTHFPQVRAAISPPSCAGIRAGRLTFNIEQTKR